MAEIRRGDINKVMAMKTDTGGVTFLRALVAAVVLAISGCAVRTTNRGQEADVPVYALPCDAESGEFATCGIFYDNGGASYGPRYSLEVAFWEDGRVVRVRTAGGGQGPLVEMVAPTMVQALGVHACAVIKQMRSRERVLLDSGATVIFARGKDGVCIARNGLEQFENNPKLIVTSSGVHERNEYSESRESRSRAAGGEQAWDEFKASWAELRSAFDTLSKGAAVQSESAEVSFREWRSP